MGMKGDTKEDRKIKDGVWSSLYKVKGGGRVGDLWDCRDWRIDVGHHQEHQGSRESQG